LSHWRVFVEEKSGVAEAVFLLGVLQKTVCRTWFFDGENVVECCVNVVIWVVSFRLRKFSSFIYF
jgi:hypothetical protein